jgi:phosphoenolpyruvate carboxykinase (ATP)
MKIAYTRAMVRAALDGSLRDVPTAPDPIFGVGVPASCPNVPNEVLQPRNTWQNPQAYDQMAKHLATLFNDNFKQFESGVSEAVKAAGPRS